MFFVGIAKIAKMCYTDFTAYDVRKWAKFIFMRKRFLKTALVFAVLLTMAACSRESSEEPDPITVVVTVEYKSGKIIQFIYHGDLVWQSDPVESMSYHRNGDMTYIDYADLDSQQKHLVFQGGTKIEK